MKKENCCKNCANAEGYSGWEAHYCEGYKCYIRAEHYDCPLFIIDNENDREKVKWVKKCM